MQILIDVDVLAKRKEGAPIQLQLSPEDLAAVAKHGQELAATLRPLLEGLGKFIAVSQTGEHP